MAGGALFDEEGLETGFGQGATGGAATDAGADDDHVPGLICGLVGHVAEPVVERAPVVAAGMRGKPKCAAPVARVEAGSRPPAPSGIFGIR